jgi:hypothetical protein
MQKKSVIAALMFVGLLLLDQARAQIAANEQEFQQLSAALKANGSERRSAIATCIKQGIGENPTGAADFMGVPVAQAAEAWCIRVTNGIADGKLKLSDVLGLGKGDVSAAAREVLTTASEGK